MAAPQNDAGSALQAAIVALLRSPAAYPDAPAKVDVIETHGAMIFLAGDHVYKIKKAVRFAYMDFSSLEKRRGACIRELEINQPCAPELYLGLVAVTRGAGGALTLGGEGEPVEWAVHMRRFRQDDLLVRHGTAHGIGTDLAREIGDAVVTYHANAPVAVAVDPGAQVAAVISELAEGLREPGLALDAWAVGKLSAAWGERLAALRPLLERRCHAGLIKRCHGDLHMGNIALWKGRPTLFDALEFDEALATTDTLYDLAFLLMDLDFRGLRPAANTVLNRYLWRTQSMLDIEGLAALPLFLGMRAAIRAMVVAQRAEQESGASARADHAEAASYLSAALGYLEPEPPRLVAVGGLSGTGKSTLAARLAPLLGAAPGALHLRSDLERKAMFGAGETVPLPASCYTRDAHQRVYQALLAKAEAGLKAGHSVVADAVFIDGAERMAIAGVAQRLGLSFTGLWLSAPADVLVGRVARRTGDASDATPDVVRSQLTLASAPSDWQLIDASGSPDDTFDAAVAFLEAIRDRGPAIDADQSRGRTIN